ncbi:hypothetical protein [Streptomyces sp. XY006]|uniref:hypothetical protein n=1 Tax=Streptomyces sp. XY006 TaxID=2021410 RepID=UPI001180B985|nr:hypothetical protein [Streptomyces sp. XY006]
MPTNERTTVAKNKQQQIKDYQQGAADCREAQKRMQAAGNTETAKAYGNAVDANLDRINELNGRG